MNESLRGNIRNSSHCFRSGVNANLHALCSLRSIAGSDDELPSAALCAALPDRVHRTGRGECLSPRSSRLPPLYSPCFITAFAETLVAVVSLTGLGHSGLALQNASCVRERADRANQQAGHAVRLTAHAHRRHRRVCFRLGVSCTELRLHWLYRLPCATLRLPTAPRRPQELPRESPHGQLWLRVVCLARGGMWLR